jgi:hypothetical protein
MQKMFIPVTSQYSKILQFVCSMFDLRKKSQHVEVLLANRNILVGVDPKTICSDVKPQRLHIQAGLNVLQHSLRKTGGEVLC